MKFLISLILFVSFSVFGAAGTGSPQAANVCLAGPTTGAAAVPTFRALVVADLPTVTVAKGGTGATTLTGVLIGNGTSAVTAVTPLTGTNGGTNNAFWQISGPATSTKTWTIPNQNLTWTGPTTTRTYTLPDATETLAGLGQAQSWTGQQSFGTTSPKNTTQNLTAGTLTATNQSEMRIVIHRYDWTNAMVTALGAVNTGNVAVCTLPAKTVIKNAYIIITGQGATVTTLNVSLGTNSATYDNLIVSADAKAVANTVYGDAKAERGTALYDGTTILNYLASFTATTVVNVQFISTGGNLSTVTASTGTVYLETYTLP